jgi:hypothetical protein
MPLSTALNGMNSPRQPRNQPASAGLAHARRSPQDHRAQLVALDLPAQRLAGPQNVLLPA